MIRALAKVNWGADQDSLLRIHGANVPLTLEYGSHAYGSATHTDLRKLDPINNEGIGLIQKSGAGLVQNDTTS